MYAVRVRFTFCGYHCWPEAPDVVAHLRVRHRHMFKVEATREVTHDSREVEFQTLGTAMRNRILLDHAHAGDKPHAELGSKSCEQLAKELCDAYGLKECWVYEDSEGGGGFIDEAPAVGGQSS